VETLELLTQPQQEDADPPSASASASASASVSAPAVSAPASAPSIAAPVNQEQLLQLMDELALKLGTTYNLIEEDVSGSHI